MLKRFAITTLALTGVVAMTNSSHAGDGYDSLANRYDARANRYDVPANRYDRAGLSWSGLYLGGTIGGRWSNSGWTTTSLEQPALAPDPTSADANFKSNGFRGALHLGVNAQSGVVVWGIEGDIGTASNKASMVGIPGTAPANVLATSPDSFSIETTWDGSVRLRAGVLVTPAFLLYGTGGFAMQEVKISATCLLAGPWCVADRADTHSYLQTGWTLGAGAETALTKHWFARAEYRHSDFSSSSSTLFKDAPIDTVDGRNKLKTEMINLGLSYKY